MWLKAFKREQVQTLVPYEPKPVVKTGRQDVASTEDMCFSCHDGFVLDSRSLWQSGKHAHPVGQKPSAKINIPIEDGKNLFPLNDDGRMYCGTCHTAHGVDWDDKESPAFMRVRDVDGQLCMACHTEKTKGAKKGFHPVLKKVHHKPEGLLQAGAKFGRKKEVICQSCHKAHVSPNKKLLLVENKKSELCGQCHDDRYGESMADAAHLKTHPVNVIPKKAKIAEQLIKAGAKQGVNGEVICQTCHRPHNAKTSQGLLLQKNENGILCQSCHTDKKTLLDSKHDMTLVDEEAKNIRDQTVKEAGACSACHLPHKGEGPKMWARAIDKNLEPMAALCLSCHDKNGLADKHTVGEFSHPVGVDVKRLGRKVPLPTFSEEGVKWQDVIQGKVSCASCHDPHQWDPNDKHNKAEPGDKGDSSNRFLRIANSADAPLCKTCHKEKWNVTDSKHDLRLTAPDAENALGQNVDESGICAACHLVHNANGSKLWARDKLSGNGTGYIACLGCHNENGLAKDKTLGKHTHPVNVDMKRLGIHTEHGKWQIIQDNKNSQSKDSSQLTFLPLYDKKGLPADNDGRVGCGTCHDPHNWTVKKKVADDDIDITKVEGDANNSFLRIADSGSSQLCLNCHVDKKTVLLSKHDLSETELKHNQSAVEDDELPAANSSGNVQGACLHCHQPHNAGPNALWSRPLGKAKTPVAKLCMSCHQENEIAGKKLTTGHNHPLGVNIGEMTRHKELPLFDSKGDQSADADRLDCASCHNAHQWNPDDKMSRSPPLLDEEGDASNSFLRIAAHADSDLCIRCHEDKKMIIGTDHDFDKKSVNTLKQKRDVSGLCGQCHVPHQGESALYLWAQPLGKGQDAVEQRCRSCHDEKKMAANKDPKQGRHPKDVKIWSTELRQAIHKGKTIPDIRAFNEEGKQTAYGSITCASCHNPHQWQAFHNKASSKNNDEGNVMTSFLRNNDSQNIVCADCHGGDGLFRYKYFHSESTHSGK
ncbi:MAG: cytochrome c3 family protein [Gammaproteobacteria bacterium]|nr:cytochrome c3 family protein [Gammaproteobacteria bacterium]